MNLKILNLWGSVGTFSWSEPEDPELVEISVETLVGVNLKILNLWGSVGTFSWSVHEDL